MEIVREALVAGTRMALGVDLFFFLPWYDLSLLIQGRDIGLLTLQTLSLKSYHRGRVILLKGRGSKIILLVSRQNAVCLRSH
jgi:hypothetical protein